MFIMYSGRECRFSIKNDLGILVTILLDKIILSQKFSIINMLSQYSGAE